MMKFRFIGTAAAEALPGPFCACDNCRAARAEGGRSLRGRSQAVINEELLIDFPADTAYRALHGQLDLVRIKHCLITHKHQDHLYTEEVGMLQPGFSHPADDVPLTFYGMKETLAPFMATSAKAAVNAGRVVLCEIEPYVPFQVMQYTVVAFPANHGPAGSVFYQISDGVSTVLYAHDTGYFFDSTWEWLEQNRPKYSLITLDCTGGNYPEGFHDGHMRLGVCAEVRDRLATLGCVTDKTAQFVNHFTHNCVGTHSELCGHAEPYGFQVSYDGCEVTF